MRALGKDAKKGRRRGLYVCQVKSIEWNGWMNLGNLAYKGCTSSHD